MTTTAIIFLTAITSATAGSAPDDLTAKIERYYDEVLRGRVLSHQIEIRRLPELKEGMEVITIHGEEKRSEPPRGSRVCWVKVRENGRLRDLPATLTVKPVELVPVANVDIPPRTPITPDLFEMREEMTQTYGATHLPRLEELSGVWAKVRIPQGSTLTERRLAPIPAVVVGQPLKIVLRLGRIEAVAEGKALEDGRIGEKIRVMNLVNGFRLRGKVERSDLVSVE